MVRLIALTACALALTTGLTGTATANEVVTSEYRLGDTSFQYKGFVNEMTAVVHRPADTRGEHPLIVLVHGHFATCSDRVAGDAYADAHEKLYGREPIQDPAERARLQQVAAGTYEQLFRWPCASGIKPVPSYRGYDYAATQLAEQGYVVVSISVNGINGKASPGQDEMEARGALINEHLRLWQQLSSSGTGPLAAQFGELTSHVDMTNVGVMGHSKAGRAVARHSADHYHGDWPAGVQVKAVVALEPIVSGGSDNRITEVPFMTVIGSCDKVSNPAAHDYFDDSAKFNKVPLHELTVHGANHSFFNTTWSPSSGEVDSGDDAYDSARPPYPQPGNCRTTDSSAVEVKQLTEDEQRRVGVGYLSAFFGRYLLGDTTFEPMLTGQVQPLGEVSVRYDIPAAQPSVPR